MKRVINLYKNAYTGLSPATWWLSAVMLINRSGTMVVPFMTLYLTETLHQSIAHAGMVMGIYGLGAICGGMVGGKLTDRFGFYNIQLAALVFGGLMFIALGQMKSFPAICVATFFLAMVNESFRPANSAAIAQYSSEANRTRSYSLNRLAINLGWAAGGALGGFIASHNYSLIFWIDGLTNISAALLLRTVLSPSKNKQTPGKNDHQDKTGPRASSALKDRKFMVFAGFTVLYALCFFQLFSTLPVFFRQQLHLTPLDIGMIMAFNGLLIGLFEMALVFSLEGKNKNLTYITIGTLLTGLSFVIFNLFPGYMSLALLSTIIMTAGEMLSMPFMNSFWVSRTTPGNRGQYAGLYTVAWSIAQVAGPYAGAQVAEHYGFTILWWWVGLVSCVAALACWWLGSANKLPDNVVLPRAK